MGNYWPSGIDFSDIPQSPREILKVAREDWDTGSEGIMELVLQDAESETGNPIIIVYAKHVPSNRTSKLFSIIHRPNNPYPVTIQLEVEDLPNFLKKSYHRLEDFERAAMGVRQVLEPISNEWVSDTPSEFRKKLREAFNLGSVKSVIINTVSVASDASDDTNGESQEDSTEN